MVWIDGEMQGALFKARRNQQGLWCAKASVYGIFIFLFVGSQAGDQDGQTGRDLVGQCVVECLARPETANKVIVPSPPMLPYLRSDYHRLFVFSWRFRAAVAALISFDAMA
jgi:hypothetical protein